ncbi:MAG: hypothetical protein ACSHYB_03180 [Roseibacillus sp.]
MSKVSIDEEQKKATAIPVERDTLRKARVELKDLPAIHFIEGLAEAEHGSASSLEKQDEVSTPEAKSKSVENSPAKEVKPRTPAFHQPAVEKGSSLNRKALESTNRGKKPSSRRFVRGILHPAAFKVASAAFFAIAVRLAMLGAVVLGTLILLDQVDVQLAWYLLILPIAALLHFATVGSARCRVCGIKEFVPSGAHKHVKTHRFLFTGPIISTALHLLLFKWFHCMFCGTAVRIKK